MSGRYLHLISDTDRRGAQVAAVQLNAAFAERRMLSEVAALRAGANVGSRLPVEVVPCRTRDRVSFLRSYDLVIAHGSTTLHAAAATVPRRFIYRSIGDPEFWLDRSTRVLATTVRYHLAAGVVALYPGAADVIRGRTRLPRGRIHVIRNAVAMPPADGGRTPTLPAARRHVLFVGALTWEKQVDQLIDAVARLDDTGLVIVGDGPLRPSLEAFGRRVLADRVRFVGAVDDPWPFYRACEVVALTSRTEGVPACVLEAAMVGTPAVAPRVGGIDTVVQDRVSGRLYRPGDDDDLVGALRDALDDHVALGEAARAVVPDYSLAVVADEWAELVERLAKARTSRAT